MVTLIIYDSSNGNILNSGISGSYQKPVGTIKYLEADIPEGRYATKVDVSKTPPTVVLSEPPIDEKAEAIEELQTKTANTEELAYMAIETALSVYEAVYPFLPQ